METRRNVLLAGTVSLVLSVVAIWLFVLSTGKISSDSALLNDYGSILLITICIAAGVVFLVVSYKHIRSLTKLVIATVLISIVTYCLLLAASVIFCLFSPCNGFYWP